MNEEEIFHEALARGPADGAAYLDRACAGDPALRASVDALLRANAGATGFMAAPPPAVAGERPAATEGPGTAVGPYKLLEPIGEGGFGVVYLAEQTQPVRRKVALKVLKPGMDTRQVVARFEAERQALAVMDHPNIARVFDGGATASGRPYFVMELVKGVPITEFCDQNRNPTRDRLELFISVCRAVQHAHQKGIIHRDLKPSNVLVSRHDTTPVVKVIDFGVAKALGQELTDKTLFTGIAQMIGTPLYMSPEQAGMSDLDVDTRSDVYSLGVLLYELLTGTTPFARERFQQSSYDEIRRIIRDEDPPRPSTRLTTLGQAAETVSANRGSDARQLCRAVRGDLDRVVMKALEKDRSRRYETATGFAADVQRYLNDEPVQACPPTPGYRLKKFARRNKGKLAAATVLGLALLLTVSVTGWAVRDRSARAEEAQRAQAARQARVTGQVRLILDEVARLEREQKWPEAMDMARRASDLLTGTEVEAEVAGQVQDTIRALELVRLLEDIRTSMEWKERSFDFRGTAERYAAAFRDGGIDLDGLTAEEAAQRVQSRPAVLAALAPALNDWAVCRISAGDKRGALTVMKVAGLVDPDPWRQKIRQAFATRDEKALLTLAAAPDLDRQPAATLANFGVMLGIMDRVDAALGVLSLARRQHPSDFWVHCAVAQALDSKRPRSLEQVAGSYRTALGLRPRNAGAWNNLGNALRLQGKLDEAIDCGNKAIELDPKNAIFHSSLGSALYKQGKVDDAIACCQRAIKLDPQYALAHYNHGVVLAAQEKLDAALGCFNKAIELDPKYADTHCNLGYVLWRQGKLDDAIACFQRAIELDPKNAIFHSNLGNALHEQGKADDAIACCQRAIELDPQYALAHYNLGLVLAARKKLDDAISCFKRAIELDPNYANNHSSLGNALYRQKKPDDAIACYRRAIELDAKHALAHYNLGVVLAAQEKPDDAIACYRRAIELDPKIAGAREKLGILLFDRKQDYDGAVTVLRKAISIRPDVPGTHFNLGLALRLKGDLPGAIAAFREAIRLQRTFAGAHSSLARCLTTCADLKLRNPQEALAAARKAVELAPQSPLAWQMMGWANYRVGEWKASIAALEKSMALQTAPKGGDASHWFFLAMAHWQTGDKDEARKWYARAVEWTDRNQPGNEELGRIRVEATQLIGVEKKRE